MTKRKMFITLLILSGLIVSLIYFMTNFTNKDKEQRELIEAFADQLYTVDMNVMDNVTVEKWTEWLDDFEPYFTSEGFDQFARYNLMGLYIKAASTQQFNMKVDDNVKIEQYFEDIEDNMIGYQVEVPLKLYYPNKDEEIFIKVKSSINLINEDGKWKIKSIRYIFSDRDKEIFIYN
ncbi:hypothetical protein [Chengkuizengella sediminis]|uniref:hypothetical protein n=1 Tax=Chengkuizengella sediminis TaxID=1885917 RepID=UPI0013896EA4|nr:hypothetical protein [Chengkuizengella sediminis]NDI34591.1 hypothetical protein [Chengkuizengella sediminis]